VRNKWETAVKCLVFDANHVRTPALSFLYLAWIFLPCLQDNMSEANRQAARTGLVHRGVAWMEPACHSERSEGSAALPEERFFAALRMTAGGDKSALVMSQYSLYCIGLRITH